MDPFYDETVSYKIFYIKIIIYQLLCHMKCYSNVFMYDYNSQIQLFVSFEVLYFLEFVIPL